MAPPFIHLHCHSQYSLLESPIRVSDLLRKCADAGMKGIALTDNGVMYGAIDFYTQALQQGIKPIIGCEMYVCKSINEKDRGLNRLILLCKDFKGYQNLTKLVSAAHLQGFYYKPRIDLDLLARFSEGLIAISPGIKGAIAYHLRIAEPEEAKRYALALHSLFKKNFYLGIQKTGSALDDMLAEKIKGVAHALNLPLVATNDVYYLNPEGSFIKEVLSCIQMGKQLDEDRARLQTAALYLKTPEEMEAFFSDIPEAIQNTVTIFDQCNLTLQLEQSVLPHFQCPDGLSQKEFLEKRVWEGAQKKYPVFTEEIRKRIHFELDTINKMGYSSYFLIIYDFLEYARQNHIPVGPGRGSAAGSIVAYALDITEIDPIRYHLLFERFLNPERVSMPDIDIDFCIRKRDKIIAYLIEKYGTGNVSQIITFGSMQARAVVRDVGRVLNIPLSEVDYIAKLIPSSPGHAVSISQAIQNVPELKRLFENKAGIQKLLDIGMQLEGFSRHTSTHAAGVVISQDPLENSVPLTRNEGQIITQYPMTDLERLGLLKIDILGLRNLTVIDEALSYIQETHRVSLNLREIPLEDSSTYDLLCRGETIGVFQLESTGMRALIKELQPHIFEDLIALLALYRPGPLGSGMVSEFISNKSGKTKPRYDLSILESILKETYGLIIYQEQVMQIASVIAGFTLGQADMLRRAMGKKKKDVMNKMRLDFMKGALKNKIPEETAGRIFDLCYKFAEYGFNKSHSAAYAMIAYQTAYLKANFSKEYMAALLSSVIGSLDKVSLYIQECRQMGISVFPPDINESKIHFTVTKEGIRFGLGAIKNVGEGAIESILSARSKEGAFKNIKNFCSRVNLKQVNKRVIESLIKCGSFDQIETRNTLLSTYEKCMEKAQAEAKERDTGQIGLFGAAPMQNESCLEAFSAQFSKLDLLKMEKETIGLYISGHPLDMIKDKWDCLPIHSLSSAEENKTVTLMGLLTGCRRVITRHKTEMRMAKLEDLSGNVTLMLFDSEKFERYAITFQDDTIVKVKGKVRKGDETAIVLESIESLEPVKKQSLHIEIKENEISSALGEIKHVAIQYPGNHPLYFHMKGTLIQAGPKYWVGNLPELMMKMTNSIGSMARCWME